MIANITSSSAIKGFVNYNENKVKKGEAHLLTVANTYDGKSKTAQSLLMNFAGQSKRKNKFLHISINFPSEDGNKLTEEKLKNIAQEYINGIKLPEDQPHIVYYHKDKNHPHIHIVTSSINAEGKYFDDSNSYRTSMATTRKLEKKYGLTQVSSIKRQEHKYTETPNLKYNIRNALDIALKQQKVSNLKELKTVLNRFQLSYYTNSGTVNTVNGPHKFNGIVYTDIKDEEQSGRGIKGSSIPDSPILPKLHKTFEENRKWHLKNRKRIARELKSILNIYQNLSTQRLRDRLEKRDIQISMRYDNSNRLVGVSFTDITNNITYSGEKIGKPYTAQNLSRLISEKNTVKPEVLTQFELNKYWPKIKHLEHRELYHYLQHLGFQVKYEDKTVQINDYKNTDQNGFITLKLDKPLYTNTLNYPTSAYAIEYNRAVVMGEINKAQEILGKMEESEKPVHNPNQLSLFSFNEDKGMDQSKLADIDKKKKRKRGRKY